MKITEPQRRTIVAALNNAIDFQDSLAWANEHIPEELKKCRRKIAKYKAVLRKLSKATSTLSAYGTP